MKLKKGFTLVELLVVISIIGLLATVAVVALGSARSKARDAKRIADVRNMQSAIEQFYADAGGYPVDVAAITLGGAANNALCFDTVAGFKIGACSTQTYMGLVPAYPNPGPSANIACGTPSKLSAYCYSSGAAAPTYATTYQIIFSLESPTAGFTDSVAPPDGINCTANQNGLNCN